MSWFRLKTTRLLHIHRLFHWPLYYDVLKPISTHPDDALTVPVTVCNHEDIYNPLIPSRLSKTKQTLFDYINFCPKNIW